MTPETLFTLSIIILLLPLLSFTILIFWGKKLGDAASSTIGTSILGVDLLLSAVVAYSKLVEHGASGMLQLKFDWFSLGTKSITVGIGIDNMTAVMLIVVTMISFLVHLFSIEYMKDDPRFPRFFAYLGIFTFSMLGIVIANNFVFMYVFWELVGLSSYLLIGFWYEKDSAADASKKAFLTNRIGDFGFFAGIMILFSTYGTFMFDDIFAGIGQGILPWGSGAMLTIAGIAIFGGAIGKSAQFPLHVWLPDAMEGPTPVSALIHAATMVAAGVYMTARVFPMFTADALLFIAYVGAITAFMAATIAVTQNDFKKVLAYSTVSQLGYMIMALGVGAFTVGFFHLVTHAWFKACLFLASGSVIHQMHIALHKYHDHHTDAQDIRNMGGLRKTMPWTYLTFLFATLAISGVPFTSGFLSKDGILAGTLAFGTLSGHWLIPLAGFGAAGMTAFYMFRLGIESFHGEPKTKFAAATKESNKKILIPLVTLMVLSFWFFYSFHPFDAAQGWFYQKLGAPETAVPAEYQWDFLVPYDKPETGFDIAHQTEAEAETAAAAAHEAEAEAHPEGPAHAEHHAMNEFEHQVHIAHMPAMILSLLIAGGGILAAFALYQFRLANPDNIANQIRPVYKFSFNKWFFDEFYDATVIKLTLFISKVSALFDNYVIDGIVNAFGAVTKFIGWFIGKFDNIIIDGIVNLLAYIAGFFGALFRKVQTGKVQTYLIFVIVGIIILAYWIF